MSGRPLRVGLIGLGQMGRAHLRVLAMLKSVDLVFVHDVDPGRTRRALLEYGVPGSSDLFADLGSVEAVVICAPTEHHAEYVQAALHHVRSVFVEKPLAATLDDALKLKELADREGALVQVGFIERYNSAVQQLSRILDQSDRVVSVDFTRTNRLSARITDVDVVTDLMIHDIDLALHLNGPVREVSAHGIAEGGMVAYAAAVLTHENGRFSRIVASRITEKKIRSIQATCTDAYIACDLLRKEIVINRQSELSELDGEPYVITATEQTVEVKPQEGLLLELQAFIAACGGAAQSPVPDVTAGYEAQLVCEKIRTDVLS